MIFTRSLALKGHGIQGSLVKILPKIRVKFSSQLVKVKGLSSGGSRSDFFGASLNSNSFAKNGARSSSSSNFGNWS